MANKTNFSVINNKAVIYCRVSSKEQEDTGYSLDAQEKLLTEYAKKNTLKAEKIYRISESASGKQIRKTFSEMLKLAIKNKINAILCEKIDRLTRNLKDAAIVSDWLLEDQNRAIHFVKENFIVSKNTRAHENLVWDMKVAIARFYTNNLSEEVKKGQKEKLAQGGYPARAPIGYKTMGDKGHKIHVIDEKTRPLIEKMFELYASGNYSINALVETMYKEGLRGKENNKIIKSRMHELLSNPFYCGENRWNGKLSKGNHEPLITKELFDSVQNKLVRKISNPQFKKHLPVFKAKICCEECGGTITWELQKGHWYGHCNSRYRNCSQKNFIRQEKIEDQLFPYFDKVAPKNNRVIRWLEKALNASHKEEIDYNDRKRDELNRIIKLADRRMEEAYKDKLDGKEPATLCEKIMASSAKEKDEAIRSLGKLGKTRKAYYEAGYAIHELASRAKELYLNPKATIQEKRLLLSYVFSNSTLNADKIKPNYTLAFEFLEKWIPLLNDSSEPAKNQSDKRKEDAFASPNPVLLPG